MCRMIFAKAYWNQGGFLPNPLLCSIAHKVIAQLRFNSLSDVLMSYLRKTRRRSMIAKSVILRWQTFIDNNIII